LGAVLDLIDDFLARYVKEFDYYDQVAHRAAGLLRSSLEAAGIRAIVTERAKSVSRLAEKCRQRNNRHPYVSVDDIYADIVDLAGVRVALYFPGEREEVGRIVNRLFVEWDASRVFPDASPPSIGKTFSGYAATHYRVRLRPQDLSESDQRYAAANIEIQVASVLMHAWSEVEHDLVYKPSEGKLSETEYSLLDQLNGLVLAGELSLQQLQRAGEARVAEGTRQFANHYELAAHLLSQASAVGEQPITDSGVGRVDLLFRLLTRLELNTPDDLRPYLDLLHGDLEQRPLAEQIIDALIAEDPSRYKTYLAVRAEADVSRAERAYRGEAGYSEIGEFLVHWARLERLVRDLTPIERQRGVAMPIPSLLERRGMLSPEMRFELDRLRRLRNELVHGFEVPSADYLQEATERLVVLISEIERRNNSSDRQEN
jgi:ppGpp synthetase/RelA/SpoT-type nucleotidyltranferase